MKQLSIDDFPLMALIGYAIFAIATHKTLSLCTMLKPTIILVSIVLGVSAMNMLSWSINYLIVLRGEFISTLYWWAGIALGYLYWKLTLVFNIVLK